MANNVVVLGAQWGDEGKGKIVDLLTERADAVVRFQGGHNAGHTLVIDGNKTVLHLVPSGALREQAECLIGNGVVVDTAQLLDEIRRLDQADVSMHGRLLVSRACPMILPHHVALDVAREHKRGRNAIGTTGRGIGPAYEDKIARRGLRLGDLQNPTAFAARLEELTDYHNFALEHYYRAAPIDYQQTLQRALADGERIKAMLGDVGARLAQLRAEKKAVLFEGAQGALLDIDHGTYPFVTSSNTIAAAASIGAGVGARQLEYVLGICKAYATRVGAGPFPTELSDAVGAQLGERGDEFGATTGRARRCGWFDAVMMRRCVQVSAPDALCITKLDVLDELPEIQLCVAYQRRGERLDTPPSDAEVLAECTPVYETMPGWRSPTGDVRTRDDLPVNAQNYLARLSALSGLPIDLISTGAERDNTIIVRHPFEEATTRD